MSLNSMSERTNGRPLSAVLPELAATLDTPVEDLERYYAELQSSVDFLEDLNKAVSDVPEFPGVRFESVDELRLYRCLLYVLTRVVRPNVFVETGTLNGFSSAFIHLALHHNEKGTLHSIDLPPIDPRIIDQGTSPLPVGKGPGWAIPENLRDRHELHIGPAEVLLPDLFRNIGSPDVFLHDSDHSYTHMTFELAFAWINVRPGGWTVCDNVEANRSFEDFVQGSGAKSLILATFDSPERIWKHGMMQRSAAG